MKNIPFRSQVEERIIHAEDPIAIDEKLYQEITINGEKGTLLKTSFSFSNAIKFNPVLVLLKAYG